jgi:hypothetical protein
MAAVVSAPWSSLCGAGIAPGRACIPWGGDVKKDILARHAVGRVRGGRGRREGLTASVVAESGCAAEGGAAQLQRGVVSGAVAVGEVDEVTGTLCG